MSQLYPVVIAQARYGGTYEGGSWLAFYIDWGTFAAFESSDAFGDDIECMGWWIEHENDPNIGRGDLPNSALADLVRKQEKK